VKSGRRRGRVSGAYGRAGRRRETPPQGEAGHDFETPSREGEREFDALPPKVRRKPEVLPRQGKREVDVSAQGFRNKGTCREGGARNWVRTGAKLRRRHGRG